jgi:hypothetical protein
MVDYIPGIRIFLLEQECGQVSINAGTVHQFLQTGLVCRGKAL